MIGRRRALLLAALSPVVLSGCTSIPLGTLWKMRDFGGQDLAGLDPAQLRVAARADAPALRFDPASMRLKLELRPRSATAVERREFGLRPSSYFDARLAPAGGRPWQVFELDADGTHAMRALQPQLANAREHYESFTFSIAWDFEDGVPAGTREVTMSVRLQLSEQQAPLALFDRARIRFDGS